MNRTEHIHCRARAARRLIYGPLLCGLLALAWARAGVAADATYVNNAVVNYPLNVDSPPVIDATNFINNSQFIINFTTLSGTQPFYETSDTLNYTNNGLMLANTGFQFDNQSSATGLRTMSASFYNSGTISCGSVTDSTALLFGFPYDQCFVNATNIVSPGLVDVGMDGLIQFTGQNVDLTRSRLTVEGGGAGGFGTGYFGLNTNYWDPSAFLGPTFAESAFFPIPPFYLLLTNSTAYFNFYSPNPSNNIISSVFIQDTSPTNVAYNVYFDAGAGNAAVEWAGSYQDVASGRFYTNYLYLNNNYIESTLTNDGVLGAIPFNFSFTESPTKLIFQTPAPAGFYNVFPSGTLTNRYAFANAQLLAGTWATNQISNLSVTNLPGRVQINASKDLNLAMAQIGTPNYMSLQATNQFDGSPGASIVTPYSDLNLGVTNGFLTLSNLMTPSVPIWSGTCQAWSTRWTTTATNSIVIYTNTTPPTPIATNIITVTNDYRVLIVGSQVNPTSVAQVQDMTLHATNSLVISDTFNVMRKFTTDARNLTLTTNGPGHGATSVDGEINVASPDIYWASSLPNLRNLTNNGAIRFQNLSQFIGTSNTVVVTPPVAASATLAEVTNTANVPAGNRVILGNIPYAFYTSITNTAANQVKIAATFDGSMSNLIAAINGGAGAGTAYSTNTVANPAATAGPLAGHAFVVTATTNGSAGNTVEAYSTASQLVWIGTTTNRLDAGTLAGGVDGYTNSSPPVYTPYDNFINNGLLSDQGSQIWADNFESSGAISNGVGSLELQSQNTLLTNGVITAGGDVTITTGSLLTSNLMIQAGRSLTLDVSDFLTDTGVTNGSVWTVGAASGQGLGLPVLPATADDGGGYGNSLLGTSITVLAPDNENVVNTWAAKDLGASPAAYTNNMAIGRLVLDAQGQVPNTQFTFTGTGVSNAIYVDQLELDDYASYTNHDAGGNLLGLSCNTNLVIYYADAIAQGAALNGGPADVSEQLNHKNGNRLRWVPTYAGHFSSTNLVYLGVTNTFNVALVRSSYIDSDGDGTANGSDPTPFFLPSMIAPVVMYQTNPPAGPLVITWNSIPNATNYLFSSTSITGPFTNMASFSTNLSGPYNLTSFISPIPYPSPATNVTVFVQVQSTNQVFYYKPVVNPWTTFIPSP